MPVRCPQGGKPRYRVKTTSSGKKVRLAFCGKRTVVEAKVLKPRRGTSVRAHRRTTSRGKPTNVRAHTRNVHGSPIAPSRKKRNVICPRCGAPVWDVATIDQRLNKCWECGLRFDRGYEQF